MPITIRKYKNSDRAKTLDILPKGVIDTPQNKVLVAIDAGKVIATVTWIFPGLIDPDIPTLGGIDLKPPGNRALYDKLLLAASDAALAEGHTRCQAYVLNEAMLRLMQRAFIIDEVTPVGRNTETGKPGYWEIEFPIAENLKRILAA